MAHRHRRAKITFVHPALGGVMAQTFKTSLLEKIPVLILLGILAGAVGGLGIGLVMSRTSSTATAGK
jgi:hypothetical protein